MNKVIHNMNKSVFGNGKGKILECFYRNKDKELYFSQILREAKLTQNTTLKHLRAMQEFNLLISTKKTANTFYRLSLKNPQVFSILSYFDYKRFNELPLSRKIAITEFLGKIENKPIISLIFGSTSKGTFSRESDIDLLLVYNKEKSKDTKLSKGIEATTGIKIQTFIIDYEYFKEQLLKKEDNVIVHAIKTGFVMTGHYYFYKEVLK